MPLPPWQLVIVICCAYCIGLSKTGLTGMGIVAIAIFASVLKVKSVGIVLPLLVCSDCVAVLYFRRHADWSHLWRLFPWAVVGIVIGWLVMQRVDARQASHLIGELLLLLTMLQIFQRVQATLWERQHPQGEIEPLPVSPMMRSRLLSAIVGVLAGFTTMVANAAGPLMILYLLAARLPKLIFVGTGAWFYLCINLIKIPFSWHLGLLDPSALRIDLVLAPFAIAGALSGRALLPHINQRLFETLALFFTALAALRLIYN